MLQKGSNLRRMSQNR